MALPKRPNAVATARVAVIHHYALLREGLCRILDADEGFEVVWQGGDAAGIVERAPDFDPNLILLEWETPCVDAALIGALLDSIPRAVVVVISRPDTQDDLAPALEAGAAGCLSVNLDARDFLAALRVLAQGNLLVSHEMVGAVTSGPGETLRAQEVLTSRELEILRAMGRGATNREIAAELFVSPHTVKSHVHRILAKMDFRNRQQAAAYAAANGLI